MKQKIKKEIFNKTFEGQHYNVRFSDLPKDIQENHIIEIRREESYHSESWSYDAYTELVVIEEVEETDEQYEERLKRNLDLKKELKNRRHETYLKLKKEFENDTLNY
jgi:hypothetical protein